MSIQTYQEEKLIREKIALENYPSVQHSVQHRVASYPNSEATLLNIRDYVQKKEMDRNWPEQRKFSEMELAKICDNCFIC